MARLKFQRGWGPRSSPTRAAAGGAVGSAPAGPRWPRGEAALAPGRGRAGAAPVGTDVRAGLVVAAGAEGRAHTEVVGGKVQQGGRAGPACGPGSGPASPASAGVLGLGDEIEHDVLVASERGDVQRTPAVAVCQADVRPELDQQFH